jgi:SM-20-related protein
MPKANFFQRLGLFAIPQFLDRELCLELQRGFRKGDRKAATVGPELVVDRTSRSVDWVKLDDQLVTALRDRLLAVKPEVESHYGLELTDCQQLQFLAYGPGDYYTAHRDCGSNPVSSRRKVSAVMFLNAPSESSDGNGYGGGALTFYELLDNPAGSKVGIPLEADQGLLVTFRSETLHSVAPVTHGERHTIATWYY